MSTSGTSLVLVVIFRWMIDWFLNNASAIRKERISSYSISHQVRPLYYGCVGYLWNARRIVHTIHAYYLKTRGLFLCAPTSLFCSSVCCFCFGYDQNRFLRILRREFYVSFLQLCDSEDKVEEQSGILRAKCIAICI